jgi:hypothetical protein
VRGKDCVTVDGNAYGGVRLVAGLECNGLGPPVHNRRRVGPDIARRVGFSDIMSPALAFVPAIGASRERKFE